MSSVAASQESLPVQAPVGDIRSLPRSERARLLGEELDALHARTVADMGERDIAYMTRVHRFSLTMEVFGRGAMYLSVLPLAFTAGAISLISFIAGVCALAVHKQLQWEIYHTVFHGAYDRLAGGTVFPSKSSRWDMPIDEEAWRRGHNVLHHGATNVLGIDPDMGLCTMRMTEQSVWRPRHRHQVLILFGLVAPNFGFLLNLHFTGLDEHWFGERETSGGRPKASAKRAWRQALRKYLPHYAKSYLLFPALAGPFFWKIMIGNFLAELLRDIYSSLVQVCGHVGEEQKSWPAGTRPSGRGDWYAMQIEATKNFEVSLPLAILSGGIDRHIEHHLFPRLPPNRLREIAPRVRAICEKHGFRYHTDPLGRSLSKAVRQLGLLSRDSTPSGQAAASEGP